MADKKKRQRKPRKGIIEKLRRGQQPPATEPEQPPQSPQAQRAKGDAGSRERELGERPEFVEPPAKRAVFIDNPPPERFWPKGKPMPKTYPKRRRELIPCPECRCILLDDTGQAVIVTSSGDALVSLRCRACDHRFQLPVEEV